VIDALMRAAIEHAGAERGLLILAQGGEHRLVTEPTTGSETVAVGSRQAKASEAELPL
jgi:hypothetical protein